MTATSALLHVSVASAAQRGSTFVVLLYHSASAKLVTLWTVVPVVSRERQ